MQAQKARDWHQELAAWLPVCAEVHGLAEEGECVRFLFDHLIDAIESAVAELLSDAPHGYMISRSASGPAICTLVLSGSNEEFTFESRSESLARGRSSREGDDHASRWEERTNYPSARPHPPLTLLYLLANSPSSTSFHAWRGLPSTRSLRFSRPVRSNRNCRAMH